jgi:gas vesicle protein
MTQENEWDRSQGSGAGFFTGLLAGALIGTGLGLLFAPRKGAELRGQVADSAATVGQAISKTVDGWTERGRDAYDRARDVATRAGDEVERMAGDAARMAGDAAKSVEKTLNVAGDMAAGAAKRVDKQHVPGRG